MQEEIVREKHHDARRIGGEDPIVPVKTPSGPVKNDDPPKKTKGIDGEGKKPLRKFD